LHRKLTSKPGGNKAEKLGENLNPAKPNKTKKTQGKGRSPVKGRRATENIAVLVLRNEKDRGIRQK